MAESDWTVAANSLGTGDVLRGSTAGITPPSEGGIFSHGFNSITANAGAVALFTNQGSFAPMASGGRISRAVKRLASAASTGWSHFLFMSLVSDDVGAVCYMLGLSDAKPSKVVLRKGILSEGFPAETIDPTVNGVLALSSQTIPEDQWIHLRLDVAVNVNGDVSLSVFENDIDENGVDTNPDFQPIAGMDSISPGSGAAFVDDVLGVATGSLPIVGGRAGFGFEVDGISRAAAFDHIEVARQI